LKEAFFEAVKMLSIPVIQHLVVSLLDALKMQSTHVIQYLVAVFFDAVKMQNTPVILWWYHYLMLQKCKTHLSFILW
jgi:hypothetical protein